MTPDELQPQTETQPDQTPDEAVASVEAMPGAVLQAEEAEPQVAFRWEASEYVHHHKSPLWYGVAGLIVLLLCAVAVWLHLWLEIGVFIVAGVAVIVYARKPPRTLTYELSDTGIHIDGKVYQFDEFRSFGVVEDTEWHSIDLEPVKRLSPRLVLLFDDEDVNEIVGHLDQFLPREDHQPDLVERITRYVRF